MSDFPDIDRLEQDARIDEVPGMANATDRERIINIRTQRQRYGLTVSQLAKMVGASESTISEVLAGKYKGDTGDYLSKLEGQINELARRRSLRQDEGYVDIRLARDIFKVLKWVSKAASIGVLYGVSGIGKTMALDAAVKTPDFRTALLVKIDDRSKARLTFCQALLQAIYGGRAVERLWTVADALKQIVDRLNRSGRLILIDEAENLPPDTLNVIRQIHDATGCPVVLVGRPHLNTVIDRTTRNPNIGGSLVGRICIRRKLSPTVSGGKQRGGNWICTVDEMAEKLARFKVRFAPDAVRHLHRLAHESALRADTGREAGGLRLVDKIALLAVGLRRGKSEITLQMVRDAHRLMDEEEAEVLGDLVERALKAETRQQAAAAS